MKVKFKKQYPTSKRTYYPGEVQRFSRQDAKRMIRQGYAEATEEVDDKDIMKAQYQVKEFEEKLQSYPYNAHGIRRALEFEDDPAIVQSFLDDGRKTVREKAQQVLKELK